MAVPCIPNGHHTTVAMHHIHDVTKPLVTLYSERPRGAGFRSVNPAERWRENPARALARAGFSQHLECKNYAKNYAINYAIIIQFVLPLTTFYRSGAQRINVYKRDAFVTSWRSHNRAWQPRRHDRLSETSRTL